MSRGTAQGRAAVFGQPIAHSRSPQLHRAAYAALGVPLEYSAIEGGAADARALAAMLRTGEAWRGASVTMPLKDALVAHVDSVSERVARLGALNTIVVSHPGGPGTPAVLRGENTDVEGIIRALADAGLARADRVAVLGAGNTATAATEALLLMGATRVDYIVRSAGRAADTLALAAVLGLEAEAIDAAAGATRLREYDAIISTLPPHAADGLVDALGMAPGAIVPGAALLDVAYDPWPSAIARAWQDAGGSVANGLSMLLHQAIEQVKLFTGITEADWGHVADVMCDAVGLPRTTPTHPHVAG
ncbi:shikimate dehydrogenase family protein [Paeniglutamicibacter cryotolerans]|uniref:Shikimate dehydrogenase n=1 Tax=Paeniglutamicibacter cryotolerans TaxID=670079 RepID=A0A839QT40_9MICC|nr:shikimate dehydrogenase [Paeniglutamicibacter cryotolerans]MBB2997136.1 shikimate dehydrogenase [Paeniglutamicibacter cryotolerans]